MAPVTAPVRNDPGITAECIPDGIEWRAAWPDERERIQRFFRLPFRFDERLHLIVAAKGANRQRLLGCAALYPLACEGREHDEARFSWAVRGTAQTVAMGLLGAVIHYARDRGFRVLAHQSFLEPDDPRSRQLESLGGKVVETLDEFECPYEAVLNRCRRIYQRLLRRREFTAGLQISGVTQSLLPVVRARLHASGIMDVLEFDDRLRPGHPQPTDLGRSTALTVGGNLIGVMLVAPLADGRGYIVPARWVEPAYRRGWANTVLIYNSTAQGEALGLEYIRFLANSAVHDETVRLARRLGGERVRSRGRHALLLQQ